MKPFYLTTTLPYVNAAPHIGFALEIIQADAVARFKKLLGYDVFFNFGTDEHGKKIYEKAIESHQDPKAYCDEYAAKFDLLKQALNLSYNNFIRTTDPHHIEASREFWRRCLANGDIYKKNYKSKYCVGCELEKTDSELVDGKCPLHPNKELEIIEEENYFFRFSKYQKKLLELYKNNPAFVVPSHRLKEIEEFVKKGLQDFSISRLKAKMPWGIDVPDDPDHVMYVWFDALINYISAIGWPKDIKKFNQWWPVTQFAGKDNLRQQSAIWQSMLLSAGIPHSQQIFIHGFISVDGQKISKSLGNVVDPLELVKTYGTDAVRYYLLREIPSYDDGDYSERRFKELYNADLANGLGNLVARLSRLAQNSGLIFNTQKTPIEIWTKKEIDAMNEFRFDLVLNNIWNVDFSKIDKHIDQHAPWAIKDKVQLQTVLQEEIDMLVMFVRKLEPFIPHTAQTILKQFKGPAITAQKPMFPRI